MPANIDYPRAKAALVELTRALQPGFKEQDQIFEAFNDVEKIWGTGSIASILGMMNTLYDGVRFGNWPWTNPNVK